jgi:hypothetical protein
MSRIFTVVSILLLVLVVSGGGSNSIATTQPIVQNPPPSFQQYLNTYSGKSIFVTRAGQNYRAGILRYVGNDFVVVEYKYKPPKSLKEIIQRACIPFTSILLTQQDENSALGILTK